jgi:SAM-dependent methyltransferase
MLDSPNSAPIAAETKRRWEQRAEACGPALHSVLYRGFTPELNEYLHHWHVSVVKKRLLPLLPQGARVLDLGCGYGRVGEHVLRARPDLHLIGADFSQHYCRLHAASLRTDTVCADIRRLPFAPGTFDGIFGVTCLMYLTSSERQKSVRLILESLKMSGHALFIDPGLELMRLVRCVLRSTRSTPTGGRGFTAREYSALGSANELVTLATGGLPLFTAFLAPLYVLRRHVGVCERILSNIRATDFSDESLRRLSLQRWVLLGRRSTGP